ncbi:hypothetical protein Tco_1482250 [Tanacetum coccineum]
MHVMGKTVNELHAMLKLYGQTLSKKDAQAALHAIRAGRIQKNNKNTKPQKAAKGKNQGKGKTTLAYAPNPKIPLPPKKDNPAKDAIWHQFGLFTIELYSFPNKSWVDNTGCGTHICNTTQGLRGSKKLKQRALNLNSLISQETSESLVDLKEVQELDTHPSDNTSLHHDEDEQEED